MPATFILGRAGTGKTRYCLEQLAARLEEPRQAGKLILLVPEQASFQMQRALALRTRQGGYCRAEVLSFSRLAQRTLGETGPEPELLSAAARAMALRRIAATMSEALGVFGAAADSHGLYRQLDGLFAELLLENVAPEELAAAAAAAEGALRRKLAAISRLYRAYLRWLGPQRIDPCQRLAALRRRLERSAWLDQAAIWVDGFAGFTGQELATLVCLARQARELAITLLVDPQSAALSRPRQQAPDLLGLFHRTESTYQRLLKLFADAGVPVTPPVRLQPRPAPRFEAARPLARLEAGLALPLGVPPPRAAPAAGGAVRVLACATHREELRQAANFIRRRVIESGGALRFRDFALIARDLRPFADLVAEVFDEYEIPYFLDRRRPMAAHAITRFVQALFELLSRDFPVAAAARFLGSGLLPLSRARAERLQNALVEHQVRGAALWRQARWDFHSAAGPADSAAQDSATRAPAGSDLDAARLRIFAALEPLVELAGAARPASGVTWAQRLHGAVARLGVRRRVESWIVRARREQAWETAELHRLAWEAFRGVLEDFHEVLGETALRVGEVGAILGSALSEATLGLAPPTLDQVLVGAVERTRHPEIKYAWVFAFNEGVFPAPPAEDRLLSAAERQALAAGGLAGLGSRRDEVFAERLLAYIACTRASCGLTVSYAELDRQGQRQFPSPLLGELQRALPELRIEPAGRCLPPTCLTEAARGRLASRAAGPARARYARLVAALRASPRHGERMGWLLRGLQYDNRCANLGSYRGPDVWDCSPTEVDAYLQCPFQHFARYGLRLEARRGPTPLALALGRAAHEILAAVTRRAVAAPGRVAELADEQWVAMLREALAEHRRAQPADLARRQPQRVFLTEVLGRLLREVVLVQAERWRRGRFEPLACERQFAADAGAAALPALELAGAPAGLVRLRGKIDRIDACRAGGTTYLLAYDYKSHAEPVNAAYLTRDRLQVFTYLLALAQAYREEPEVRPAGVLLAPLYADLNVLGNRYAAAADEREQRLYMHRPRGLFEAVVARLLDSQLTERPSPVAQMRLRKDGELDRRSDVAAAGELEQRMELARRTIRQAADGLLRGGIDVAPLLENERLACDECDFRPLCRFEPVFNAPRPAARALPGLSDLPAGRQESRE